MIRKAKILIFTFFCIFTSCSLIKDDTVIVGETSWEYWKQNTDWHSHVAPYYQPALDSVEMFANAAKNSSAIFIVFASSFCDDCERELPKIFKLFELASIEQKKIKLYGLDKSGREPSGEYKRLGAESLPAVFIEKNGKIIGKCAVPETEWLREFLHLLKNGEKP